MLRFPSQPIIANLPDHFHASRLTKLIRPMTTLHGTNCIAGERRGSDRTFAATSPLDGSELPTRFCLASLDDVEAAMTAAAAAADPFAHTTGEARAVFLEHIADEIMSLGDTLIERAHAETALPAARLTG